MHLVSMVQVSSPVVHAKPTVAVHSFTLMTSVNVCGPLGHISHVHVLINHMSLGPVRPESKLIIVG